MPAKTIATTIGLALLTTALPFARALPAQEVIDLPGRDQPLDADFEEVFRIGVMDGAPWEMFGGVRYVGFDESGNLYIVDGLGGGGISPDDLEGAMRAVRAMLGSDGLRVLVFDASGKFMREFGSAGEGPGEFKMPTGFAVMRDGTMVVMDIGHRAYQLFDANGEFQRMVRGSGRWNTMLADPRGGGVFTGDIFTLNGDASISRSFISGDGTPSGPPTSRPVLRLDLGDEDVHTDTVVEGWLPPVGGEDIEVPQNIRLPGNAARALSRSMSGFSLPAIFEPQLLAGVLPDGGIVHSDSSAYALKITPPDAGEVARVIRRPLRPEPVTPAIRKKYKENRDAARKERMGGIGSGGIVMRSTTVTVRGNPSGSIQPSSTVDFPEPRFYPEIPVLRSLSTTWEGRIWVQRRVDDAGSTGPIDVVTADGRYVGTFATDATRIPEAFGPNGLAAFIELDDFDVARVVVRRLSAAVR